MICFEATDKNEAAALAFWLLGRYVGWDSDYTPAEANAGLFWAPTSNDPDEPAEGPISAARIALDEGNHTDALQALEQAVTLASMPIPPPKRMTQKHQRAADERAELLKACKTARLLVQVAIGAATPAT